MHTQNKKVLSSLVAFLFIVLSAFNVQALVGISPSSFELDYKPNLEKTFAFSAFTDGDTSLKLSVIGDLANYTTLSRKSLIGTGNFEVYLNLPENIEVPGTHTLSVSVRESVGEAEGFQIVGDVRAVIKIKVPYPGQYADIEFQATNAKAGEPVSLNLKITSLGNETINTNTYINVYNLDNEIVKRIDMGSRSIESTNYAELSTKLETKDLPPGNYKAIAFVEYGGKVAEREAEFRLGELKVLVSNYTAVFERNKINRFEIEVESFWNDPIDNVFAEVSIPDHDIQFLTPSIGLGGFEKKMLTGFFDSSSIEEDNFKAKIVIHYAGKTTEKTVDLRFKREFNYTIYATILILLAVIAIAIIEFIRINKLKRKIHGKTKK